MGKRLLEEKIRELRTQLSLLQHDDQMVRGALRIRAEKAEARIAGLEKSSRQQSLEERGHIVNFLLQHASMTEAGKSAVLRDYAVRIRDGAHLRYPSLSGTEDCGAARAAVDAAFLTPAPAGAPDAGTISQPSEAEQAQAVRDTLLKGFRKAIAQRTSEAVQGTCWICGRSLTNTTGWHLQPSGKLQCHAAGDCARPRPSAAGACTCRSWRGKLCDFCEEAREHDEKNST